jgi:hypothetical protein
MMAFSGQEEAMKKARFSEEQMVRIQAGPVLQRRQTHSLYDARAGRGEGPKRDIDTTNVTNR